MVPVFKLIPEKYIKYSVRHNMGRGSGCLKWHSCGIDKGQDVCPPG